MALNRSDFEFILVPSQILYFPCKELRTDIPHYFICICRDPNGNIILSCCTSQFTTVSRLIDKGKFPKETLVLIPKSDPKNDFAQDTYINCNEYFRFTVQELWVLYKMGRLTIRSELPKHSMEEILTGLSLSPMIEQEIIDNLPSPGSL